MGQAIQQPANVGNKNTQQGYTLSGPAMRNFQLAGSSSTLVHQVQNQQPSTSSQAVANSFHQPQNVSLLK